MSLDHDVHLTREIYRNYSFWNWSQHDHEWWPAISAMAESGFYYKGRASRATCFRCHAVIDNWQFGDKLQDRHRRMSPQCQMVLGIDPDNKPMLLPDSLSVQQTGSVLVANGFVNVGTRESLRALLYDVRLRFDRYATSPTVPPRLDYNALRSERERLYTFVSWSLNSPVRPDELAAAGFFFSNVGEEVKCAFCRGTLNNWEEVGSPLQKHKKYFPKCPFLCDAIDNIPMLDTSAQLQHFGEQQQQHAVPDSTENDQQQRIEPGNNVSLSENQQEAMSPTFRTTSLAGNCQVEMQVVVPTYPTYQEVTPLGNDTQQHVALNQQAGGEAVPATIGEQHQQIQGTTTNVSDADPHNQLAASQTTLADKTHNLQESASGEEQLSAAATSETPTNELSTHHEGNHPRSCARMQGATGAHIQTSDFTCRVPPRSAADMQRDILAAPAQRISAPNYNRFYIGAGNVYIRILVITLNTTPLHGKSLSTWRI